VLFFVCQRVKSQSPSGVSEPERRRVSEPELQQRARAAHLPKNISKKPKMYCFSHRGFCCYKVRHHGPITLDEQKHVKRQNMRENAQCTATNFDEMK
jgi:hypothetical protein